MRPAQKSALQEPPCPMRVLPIPSGTGSTKGTSRRGSPAPVTTGWWGFLRAVVPGVYGPACVQPQLSLERGTGTDWGLVSILERKRRAGFGEKPSVLLPGAPSSVGPPPRSPPVRETGGGSPFAEAAATELGRNVTLCGFCISSYLGCPRTWPCILLSLAPTPCLHCRMTEKRAYISRGTLPVGWNKGTSTWLFLREILVTCGPCSGDRIGAASLLGLVSDPSAANLTTWVWPPLKMSKPKEAAFVAWDFNTDKTSCSHIRPLSGPGDPRRDVLMYKRQELPSKCKCLFTG